MSVSTPPPKSVTSAALASGDTPRRKPRGYIVNPAFQWKYTLLLCATVLAVMGVLGYFIQRLVRESTEHAQFAAAQAEKALEESKTTSRTMRALTIATIGDDPAAIAQIDADVAAADRKAEENLTAVRKRREEAAKNHERLLYTLVGGGAGLLVLLIAVGIFITQKIVGPVHRIKRLLRQVGTGRLVIKERLRRGDELGDLFDTFLQMTYSLKALQLGRLSTLESAIRDAEAKGVPEEVLAQLRELRMQTQLGLRTEQPSIPPPPR